MACLGACTKCHTHLLALTISRDRFREHLDPQLYEGSNRDVADPGGARFLSCTPAGLARNPRGCTPGSRVHGTGCWRTAVVAATYPSSIFGVFLRPALRNAVDPDMPCTVPLPASRGEGGCPGRLQRPKSAPNSKVYLRYYFIFCVNPKCSRVCPVRCTARSKPFFPRGSSVFGRYPGYPGTADRRSETDIWQTDCRTPPPRESHLALPNSKTRWSSGPPVDCNGGVEVRGFGVAVSRDSGNSRVPDLAWSPRGWESRLFGRESRALGLESRTLDGP